ncbi:MAG TPA: hypothetical protein VFZ65_13140 [Planctomycetota bacterium]|nr:hypothetical protein [Planctomycetota bacterium]
MRSLLAVATVFTTSAVVAQCPFTTVVTQPHGVGCDPTFFIHPTLTGALNVPACQLQLTVGAFAGCCGTVLVGTLLALGDQPLSVPVPQLGANCTLLVQPIVLLFVPSTTGATFSLPLPTVLPPLTVEAQGGVLYFTTIGASFDFALSQGLRVTMS